MAHLNSKGTLAASSILAKNLYDKNILPLENFCKMNYEYFLALSQYLPKDEYNDFMEKVFKISVEKIRQKKKIRVGFVLYDASMWCGDDIYNFFAQNERYEVTIFLCLRLDKNKTDTVIKDFRRGVEQFKAEGLNVVGISDPNAEIPSQDILMLLTPYLEVLPKAFQFNKMTAETLIITIPYAFYLSKLNIYNLPIVHCLWKFFFETEFNLEQHKKECTVGMPRGYYSGYPRLDKFFKPNAQFNFEWKMAVPKPIKIIWTPHWSINGGVKYATFQWNYQFMYNLEKQNPQISWVVKPHPNLMFSATESRIFSNIEAFEEYLQKWNDLPNAKVVAGAYYHDIFATSDGIILDSGSFIGEYQYTHKPMIFLTRDTQNFNDLFAELMKCLYLVDCKDFYGIIALIQKVFIDGKDDMFSIRKDFFDKYFDYVKKNGMLASEFIFKTISEEFE